MRFFYIVHLKINRFFKDYVILNEAFSKLMEMMSTVSFTTCGNCSGVISVISQRDCLFQVYRWATVASQRLLIVELVK
jgi:predicted metal-binding protein